MFRGQMDPARIGLTLRQRYDADTRNQGLVMTNGDGGRALIRKILRSVAAVYHGPAYPRR